MWKGELACTLHGFADDEAPARGVHYDAFPSLYPLRDRDVLGKFYGQATKGVRWMPWRQQTTKDVASCDKPRGAASRL